MFCFKVLRCKKWNTGGVSWFYPEQGVESLTIDLSSSLVSELLMSKLKVTDPSVSLTDLIDRSNMTRYLGLSPVNVFNFFATILSRIVQMN